MCPDCRNLAWLPLTRELSSASETEGEKKFSRHQKCVLISRSFRLVHTANWMIPDTHKRVSKKIPRWGVAKTELLVYNNGCYPPVAKLDIAVDSDSKGRGFESLRADQKEEVALLCDFFFFTRIWFSPYGIYKFVRESLFLQRPYSFIRGMLLCTTSGAGRCGHRPL